jgi:hypothetical protein
MTTRNRFAVPLALVVALAITPLLSGCINPANIVNGVIDQATGGKAGVGGTTLPKDFPKEIPIIDGDILFSAFAKADEGTTYNITVKPKSDKAFETITKDLEAAGFAENGEMGTTSEKSSTGVFANDTYTILVVVADDSDNGTVVNYTVGPADSSK